MRRSYGDVTGGINPQRPLTSSSGAVNVAVRPLPSVTTQQHSMPERPASVSAQRPVPETKKKQSNEPKRPLSHMLPEHLRGKVIPFGCSDKKIADVWTPDRDLAAFPQAFRIMCLGPPNCGKSTLAKTILSNADPPFDELYIIHEDYQPDGGGTTEWDDCDPTEVMGEPPSLAWWDNICSSDDPDEPPVRRLVVIDDLESTGISKERQRNLATLFRYCSSHHGISLILCFQNMFGLPPLLRKMANIIIAWRPVAKNEMGLIANRVGLDSKDLDLLFDAANELYPKTRNRNSLCFDFTDNTPAPIRVNLSTPVSLHD